MLGGARPAGDVASGKSAMLAAKLARTEIRGAKAVPSVRRNWATRLRDLRWAQDAGRHLVELKSLAELLLAKSLRLQRNLHGYAFEVP